MLRWTYIDGVFFAVMVATAESFALFYFARQGISATELAVLSTVPILAAAVLQLIVPRLVSRAHLGAGIVAMMGLQLLGLGGLIAAVLSGDHFWIPLGALVLYWAGGQCAGPLWLDWVAQYCPREDFERFFGKRTAVLQFVTLFVFIFCAYLIDWGLPFVWIFVLSAVARLCSVVSVCLALWRTRAMTAQHNTVMATEENSAHSDGFSIALKVFLVFIVVGGVFRFSVNTASPFFLTYMIDELKLSTTDYVWLSSVPMIGKVLFQINWAKAKLQGHHYHAVQTSCLVISLLPWMWTLSDNFAFLILVQVLSGLLWGGLEFIHVLLAQNLAYGQSRKYASLQMAVFQSFAVGGALLGGFLLDKSWTSFEVFNLSTGLRLVSAALLIALAWRFSFSRISLRGSYIYLSTVMSIRPSAANVWNVMPVRLSRLRRNGLPRKAKDGMHDNKH